MSNVTRILNYLQDRRDEMVDFLVALAKVESPSEEGSSQTPAFALFAEALWELDYVTRHLPGQRSGGQLYARPRERRRGRPIQLLVGHIDTIWPRGTLATMPVKIDQDQIRGPGVYDMKGGLTQIVFALEALRVLALEVPLTPVVFVNSDEEIGSNESTERIRRLARIANRAYVLEPSLGQEGRLKTARRGIGRFTIRVKGRAAAGDLAGQEKAAAVLELSHQIQRLFTLNDPVAGVVVNVAWVDSGLRTGASALESHCNVDVRVSSRETAVQVERALRELTPVTPGLYLEVEGGFTRPPMEKTPAMQSLWGVARTIGLELGIDLQQATAGGGSDANTTSQYTPTLDGLGAVGDGAHARHEFLFVNKLAERTALLVLLLLAPPLDSPTAY